jgi:hypothetical protein
VADELHAAADGLVVSTGFDTQLAFFKNVSESGNLAFLNPKVFSSSIGFAYYLRPLDVNNNGAIDLVWPNIQGHAIHVMLNLTPQQGGSGLRPEKRVRLGEPFHTGSPERVPERRAQSSQQRGESSDEETSQERGPDLRELLGITDTDTVRDILIKLESIGEKP